MMSTQRCILSLGVSSHTCFTQVSELDQAKLIRLPGSQTSPQLPRVQRLVVAPVRARRRLSSLTSIKMTLTITSRFSSFTTRSLRVPIASRASPSVQKGPILHTTLVCPASSTCGNCFLVNHIDAFSTNSQSVECMCQRRNTSIGLTSFRAAVVLPASVLPGLLVIFSCLWNVRSLLGTVRPSSRCTSYRVQPRV